MGGKSSREKEAKRSAAPSGGSSGTAPANSRDAPRRRAQTTVSADVSYGDVVVPELPPSRRNRVQQRVEAFYRMHNPQEVHKVPGAMTMRVTEEELIRRLHNKYKVPLPGTEGTPAMAPAARSTPSASPGEKEKKEKKSKWPSNSRFPRAQLEPTGLYKDLKGWDPATLARAVDSGKLAPFASGAAEPPKDPISGDTMLQEECQVCMLYYAQGLNRCHVCDQGFCSDCFTQIAPSPKLKQNATCPFCAESPLKLKYMGPQSKEALLQAAADQKKADDLENAVLRKAIEEEEERVKRRMQNPLVDAEKVKGAASPTHADPLRPITDAASPSSPEGGPRAVSVASIGNLESSPSGFSATSSGTEFGSTSGFKSERQRQIELDEQFARDLQLAMELSEQMNGGNGGGRRARAQSARLSN